MKKLNNGTLKNLLKLLIFYRGIFTVKKKDVMRQKKLKIAIIAPPFGSTGGPEVATQNLVNGLIALDQDITLFAPADWTTEAKHIPTLSQSLWNMKNFSQQDVLVRRNAIIASQNKALLYDNDFDIFHFHSQKYAASVGMHLQTPHILTLHNRMGPLAQLAQLDQINDARFHVVAITQSQKGTLPIDHIILHGIPVSSITPSYEKRSSYLICIGRIAEQKGIHIAIEIAKKAGKKLLIIGRVGNNTTRQSYYQKEILPFVDGDRVKHIPMASREEVYAYMQKAEALLFPIVRPEAFGLVAAEALACGTPVIASRIDPLPEILPVNAEVAFLSDDIDELVNRAKNVHLFDRKQCRLFAENNFDSGTMAEKYLDLYTKIAL